MRREHRPPLLCAEVERQRALVAVEPGEIPGEALAGRALAAQGIADARCLHLDDIRAHIGQHAGAERPGQDARQIDDPDPRQRHAGLLLTQR
jgi:hypothetical protein